MINRMLPEILGSETEVTVGGPVGLHRPPHSLRHALGLADLDY